MAVAEVEIWTSVSHGHFNRCYGVVLSATNVTGVTGVTTFSEGRGRMVESPYEKIQVVLVLEGYRQCSVLGYIYC